MRWPTAIFQSFDQLESGTFLSSNVMSKKRSVGVRIIDDEAEWTMPDDEQLNDQPVTSTSKPAWKSSFTPANNNAPSRMDLSPPRNRHVQSRRDLSPPRNRQKQSRSDLSPPRNKKQISSANKDPQQPTTVYRDKSGKKIDVIAARHEQNEKDRQAELALLADQEWGRGSVQRQSALQLQQEMEKMKNTPFARGRDDEGINRRQKETVHWDDPMRLHVLSRHKEPSSVDLGSQVISKFPVYKGPAAPPNRFGIMPGYRWDGIVRGTGFENEWFKAQAGRGYQKEEAYKWSVEDM